MLIKEMEIYALGSLVDSGWMLLDGWRYRALKHGNAHARIHREAWEWCTHGARCAGKLCLIVEYLRIAHRVMLQVCAMYSLV
jgi:hypothetical protein